MDFAPRIAWCEWYNHGTGLLWALSLSSRLPVRCSGALSDFLGRPRWTVWGSLHTFSAVFWRALGSSWKIRGDGSGSLYPYGLPRGVLLWPFKLCYRTVLIVPNLPSLAGVVGSLVYQRLFPPYGRCSILYDLDSQPAMMCERLPPVSSSGS